jgi:hypothetical protein
METCPWCSAPRVDGAKCPRCGADYAKAEQIKRQGKAVAVPPEVIPSETPTPAVIVGLEDTKVEDPRLELKITLIAPPAALALGVLFHYLMPGAQRIFFGMPVHELGHAATAWFCGFFAIPTLWKTLMWDERGFAAPLALAGGLAYLAVRAWRADKPMFVAFCAAALLVQGVGTLGTSERTAQMLVTFGGDGMGMVLAAVLMATFFFGKDTQLYKGWTRWGLLAIGAAAFSDMSATWLRALRDRNAIPFGEIEGVGLSDPMRLIEDYGWSTKVLVQRYVTVGSGSMLALAGVYVWAVLRARRYAREVS